MRIFLVRHGQSEANVDWSQNTLFADATIPLTAAGHEQAQGAGAFLAAHFEREYGGQPTRPKIRLWHSPYRRAHETADHIHAACTDSAAEQPRSWFIDQKMHFLLYEQDHGIYDGLSDEERARDYPKEWAYYQKHKRDGFKVLAQFPLGESRIQVATRMHQAFGTFHRDADKHGIDTIVVVAHGTTNRCFTFAWLHKPLEWLEAEPNPKNCSVRLLEDGEDRGYIFAGYSGGLHAGQ